MFKGPKVSFKTSKVGCAAAQKISKLLTEEVVEYLAVMEFKDECREFAIGVIEKLIN